MEMHDFQNVSVILNDMFSQESLNAASRNYMRFLYFEIIRIIVNNTDNQDDDMAGMLNSELLLGEMLDHFDNPEQVVSYIYTTIIEVCKGNRNLNISCREIVNKAREFINKSYAREITVKDLACKYAVNPNYFSTIFKQETGVTLMKYLSDTRINKACQLLRDTCSTISEIAQVVGYEDTQYFYRVFKKAIGQTPLEYRNNERYKSSVKTGEEA
jgi:YesN/AraC family two-component response regulator